MTVFGVAKDCGTLTCSESGHVRTIGPLVWKHPLFSLLCFQMPTLVNPWSCSIRSKSNLQSLTFFGNLIQLCFDFDNSIVSLYLFAVMNMVKFNVWMYEILIHNHFPYLWDSNQTPLWPSLVWPNLRWFNGCREIINWLTNTLPG